MILKIKNQTIPMTSLEWSGSIHSPSRQITAEFPLIPNLTFSSGAGVQLFDDKNEELFRGFIFTKNLNSQAKTISITAYDGLVYLLKSKTSVNFKTTTPQKVVDKIKAETGIKIGGVSASSTSITLKPMIDVSYYDILLNTYKEVKKKTGKKYIPIMKKGALIIYEKGQQIQRFMAAAGSNILDSEYSESIEDVINKVIIVDDKGKRVGQVSGSTISKYGLFQAVYQKESNKNVTAEAKTLLNDIEREANVSALGDTKCISGYAVAIKDTATGLNGVFHIDEDTHRWTPGSYTMDLKLNFHNIMDGDE